MLRGINQQRIFEDDEDNDKFLLVLEDCKSVGGFELYGFCLMGNHVHLLMKTGQEELEQVFRRLGARYVYWYNWKYRRSGHLFQDRYKSEAVEDDRYLLAVLRYIHQNPVKSNLCDSPEGYRWSSYNEYISGGRLVDVGFVLDMTGIEEFVRYNNAASADAFLENTAKSHRLTDGDAKVLMREVCNCDTVEAFLGFDEDVRKTYIKRLREAGISIRQLSRLTGISKGIIEKYQDR